MLRCMRTTVRLDDHLHAEAKKHAAESGQTLTLALEQALRESLARRGARASAPAGATEDRQARGVRAGVDLDDSAALLD